MVDWLLKLWRNYNLSLVLLACFVVTWALQAWTGWQKFSADQLQHNEVARLLGDDGYIWHFAEATFENWQSEFLQLLAMVVLTSFLIHRGSAESKDSNDRMEAKLDELRTAMDEIVGKLEGEGAPRSSARKGKTAVGDNL